MPWPVAPVIFEIESQYTSRIVPGLSCGSTDRAGNHHLFSEARGRDGCVWSAIQRVVVAAKMLDQSVRLACMLRPENRSDGRVVSRGSDGSVPISIVFCEVRHEIFS